MFSYLSFLNLENEYLSSVFKYNLREDDLASDPLNYRFNKIDIFYIPTYLSFVL